MPSHFSLQQVNDFSRTETNCQIGEWKVILCRTGLSTIQETTDIPLRKPCRRTEGSRPTKYQAVAVDRRLLMRSWASLLFDQILRSSSARRMTRSITS